MEGSHHIQLPNLPNPEKEQQSFYKPVPDDKQPGYPKPLERMSKNGKAHRA